MKKIFTVFIGSGLLLFAVRTSFAQMYTITDLGPLSPSAINTWGQVVGTLKNHAFMWTKFGGFRDLGTIPGGTVSSAADINDFGMVTGTAVGPGTVISTVPDDPDLPNVQCSSLTQPFIWTQNNGMQGLGTLSFLGSFSLPYGINCEIPIYATAINDRGQVVGYTYEADTYQFATLWTRTDGMVLFAGSYPPFFGNSINIYGHVVGQNGNSGTYTVGHATLWNNASDLLGTDLGTLGGAAEALDYGSAANHVNDLGQIVGWSTTTPIGHWNYVGSPVHAVLWSGGTIRDLGTLSGDASSAAWRINLFGQVIGSSGDSVYVSTQHQSAPFNVVGRPFVWSERSGMRDLNGLITSNSGWVLNTATDINVWGQIVGTGTRNGQPHGYLLTPRTLFQF